MIGKVELFIRDPSTIFDPSFVGDALKILTSITDYQMPFLSDLTDEVVELATKVGGVLLDKMQEGTG